MFSKSETKALVHNNLIYFVNARVAQLVELLLAKEEVAGSSPVSRSRKTKKEISNRISSFFVFSSPVRTRRFSVYVPLRSAQSQHPQDAVRRLALSENKKDISNRILLFLFFRVLTGLEGSRSTFASVGAKPASSVYYEILRIYCVYK